MNVLFVVLDFLKLSFYALMYEKSAFVNMIDRFGLFGTFVK